MRGDSELAVRFMKVDAKDLVAVAKAKRAIAHIYDTKARKAAKEGQAVRKHRRLIELELVFAFTWAGMVLPDDDAGRDYLWIAACHLWHIGRSCGAEIAIRNWASEWAPWCVGHELAELIDRVADNPRKWKADELAHELGVAVLPFAVRQALGLTTIGSTDVDKAGREQLRSEKSKGRSTKNRRGRGQVSREEYLATHAVNRTKPWVALGISRATYFRRQKIETGANAAIEEGILVRSHLSHDELTVDQRRAPKASRRLPDEIIPDGGVALARRLETPRSVRTAVPQ